MEFNKVESDAKRNLAESKVESIHSGICALGAIMQVVDLDEVPEDTVKNLGFMLTVLSDVASDELQVFYSDN